MLKHHTAALLFCAAIAAPFSALAQSTTPQPVKWELQVLQDGQQTDIFTGTTSVGQARTAVVTVNGVNQTVSFPETPDYNTVVTKNITVQLKAGNNTIKFSNPSSGAPNLDRIVV